MDEVGSLLDGDLSSALARRHRVLLNRREQHTTLRGNNSSEESDNDVDERHSTRSLGMNRTQATSPVAPPTTESSSIFSEAALVNEIPTTTASNLPSPPADPTAGKKKSARPPGNFTNNVNFLKGDGMPPNIKRGECNWLTCTRSHYL